MFTREGFWRGSDRNPEAIVHVEWSQDLEVSPATPSRALVTCWKIMDPEMLPLPGEQYPMICEPKTRLRKRQVKQLLSTTERILEVRAITSGSDVSLASFS